MRDIERVDALDKVNAKALYVYDLKLPGMLWAKLVRSTVPHALIKRIEAEKTLSVPGVVAVVTGREIAHVRAGIYIQDRTPLAYEKVRYLGEPVAAVLAKDQRSAEEAAELVEVEYEELPAVFNPLEALRSEAPLVHEKLQEYHRYPEIKPLPNSNVANVFRLRKGDAEAALSKSYVVVEDSYSEAMISHVYMEPMAVIAQWLPDGTLDVWTSAQSPFAVRNLLSKALELPESKVVVHVPYVGGGFGGKAGLHMELLVALLSKAVGGRPVKLVLSREENFYVAPSKVGVTARAQLGVNKEGKMTALKVSYVVDAGAYADYAVNVGKTMGYIGAGPYDVPNVWVDSTTVYTNKPFATAFRGFGILEAHWVVERQIEAAARKLGIDPVEFRFMNRLRPGSTTSTGQRISESSGDLGRCLQTAAELVGWGKPKVRSDPYIYKGRGVAMAMKGPSVPPYNSAQAYLKFNEDGTIDVSVGTTEIGQGTMTSIVQLVADEFGVPPSKVRIDLFKDTSRSAYTWQTVGSRSLFYDGNAVLAAVDDAKAQIRRTAAKVLNAEESEIVISEGKVKVRGDGSRSLDLKDVAMGYVTPTGNVIGSPIVGRGSFVVPDLTYLDSVGQGSPFPVITFGAQAVEVEVDVLTGEVKVEKYVGVFDLGKVINKKLAMDQLVGGAVMAISLTLYEALKFDEGGALLNPNLVDYKVAKVTDVNDRLVGVFLENPQPNGPKGARGIGENALLGIPAAVGNAIYDAIGVSVREIPITAERLWREIRSQRPELQQV
ncbi:xanthine dehydrogenase, molybdenum binding subunit [Sulfodiicoccus acidiphilus]|uniref:Xanthine dehydrogenase, molybdenum binding subunit n=1 Tax=Sulfodiicoccus acidiphilus TaxID=1670455 RepID=A0A348B6D2_9CREN|nr:xanthine dehydrogenase family protein molybdopterin-binding subunit [Sulfodiicoccus acidiphilus]BBD73734.1 xanthine dehydrogenase, molybdenum binding subunit [Sulfodiicoccus acidiphilus]GGT97956.1 xanthine dehydrogenase, molybdenum binding subunit [Sulfodiicoccus acidiphilus]